METFRKLEINFENIEGMKTSDDFIPLFCKKVILLLEEFETEYEIGINNSDKVALSDITHKISATMRLLKLDDFYEFTRSYKNLDLNNQNGKSKLLARVLEGTGKLRNELKSKIETYS